MALSEFYKITGNKTLMTAMGSAVFGIVILIYALINGSQIENQDRQIIIQDTNAIKSELKWVKAQLAQEVLKADNVTLINPSNITLVVPTVSTNLTGDIPGQLSQILK